MNNEEIEKVIKDWFNREVGVKFNMSNIEVLDYTNQCSYYLNKNVGSVADPKTLIKKDLEYLVKQPNANNDVDDIYSEINEEE